MKPTIEINVPVDAEFLVSVTQLEPNDLFVDVNGDYGIRVTGGWITVKPNEVAAYSDEELEEYEFFERIRPVKGTYSLKLDLEEV